MVSHSKIAPPLAGTLFGLTNTAATLPGVLAPLAVGALTPGGGRGQWGVAWAVTAAVMAAGGVVYLATAEVEPQPWAVTSSPPPAEWQLMPESRRTVSCSGSSY